MTNEQSDKILDDIGAGTVVIVATEAMASLPWGDMNFDQKRGAILLFDQILSRIKSHLPTNDPRFDAVFRLVAATKDTAVAVREATDIPPQNI